MTPRGTAALIASAALSLVMSLSGCTAVEQTAGARSAPAATTPTKRPSPQAQGTLPTRALAALPPEAAATWRLIQRGGPFPYPRDGVVFQNRERRLPIRERGYYHEYTVPTPGSRDRGARRLISGDGTRELYYTGDHYRTFVIVDVRR
ncbi:ribonuclease domain-containing protein [Streptosporangium saharense]|uniref:Guanyl-specific ribonuclease Sa n=1 Tax=Streptosporangium saharense TaxID=1706840 RepID=A0A7W7QGL9_9ACTN|nr:ribonuclease domain-containing protein [Streptosporangium saharense]MBB4913262.1 guanyl-specific ribonuclease Sa [Streptosporangium saharense]